MQSLFIKNVVLETSLLPYMIVNQVESHLGTICVLMKNCLLSRYLLRFFFDNESENSSVINSIQS